MIPSAEKQQINEIIEKLKNGELAFVGKKRNQPVIVYRHHRWHLITFGFLVDQKMHSKQGISNINFMTSTRAGKYITEELNFCKIAAFTELLPHFKEELDAKVLPAAEDYRPLLQQGFVQLAGGFTTDTLQSISSQNNDLNSMIDHLAEMMKEGRIGPFLHFEKYFTAFH